MAGLTDDKVRLMLKELHRESFLWALRCSAGDESEALDVLQNVYVKVIEGKARFSGQSGFKTWLFSVIKHTAAEHDRKKQTRLRKEASIVDLEALAIDNDAEQNIIETEASREIQGHLQQLPHQQRQVLELVFFHELTIREASEIMDISLGTARTHYERGKSKMKSLLTGRQLTNK